MPQSEGPPPESDLSFPHLSAEETLALRGRTFPGGEVTKEPFKMVPPAIHSALTAEMFLDPLFSTKQRRQPPLTSLFDALRSHSRGLSIRDVGVPIAPFVAAHAAWSELAHSITEQADPRDELGVRRKTAVYHLLAKTEALMGQITPLALSTQEHFRQFMAVAMPELEYTMGGRIVLQPLMEERDAVFATPTARAVGRYLDTLDALLLSRYFETWSDEAVALRKQAALSRPALEAAALMQQALTEES